MGASTSLVIETRDLSKAYKGVQALTDFDLKLTPGILGLLGPNGAGKSTLMRMLATITKPTEGTILWNGRDVVKDPEALRSVLRQLPAAWLASVLATALFGIAWVVVLLSNGDLPGLAGWVGAVTFVPTLALALGVFSSGSRAFEVVYVIWWYLGPLQKTPGMDFISGPPQVYLLAAVGLLLLSAYWRGRQVRV